MAKQRRRRVVRPVRLSLWHDDHLRRWARSNGGNKSEVVREMIEARVRQEEASKVVELGSVDSIVVGSDLSSADLGRAA